MGYSKDITGMKFNHLTAVRFHHNRHNGLQNWQFWLFKCDCGEEFIARKNSVVGGRNKYCDKCVKNAKKHKMINRYSYLIGAKSGILTVNNVSYIDKKVKLICVCECGGICQAEPSAWNKGAYKSCGCQIPNHIMDNWINKVGMDEVHFNAGIHHHTQVNNHRNNKLFTSNKTGYRGVTFNKRTNRWDAKITVARKTHTRSAKTMEEAIQKREQLYNQFIPALVSRYDSIKGK